MNLLVLSILLIVSGLVIVYLSGNAKYPLLIQVVFWIGIFLVFCGALFLLTPALVWLSGQLKTILGA